MTELKTLPPWFRQKLPAMDRIRSMKCMLDESGINTVCENAKCPNIGQCWGRGLITFMILGDTCTRSCRFCAVKTGHPNSVNLKEPCLVAESVKKLDLQYVVITSVTRDDLNDKGASQFARTILEIRRISPNVRIEVLIPDFNGNIELIKIVMDEIPDVLSHNIEVVPRLSNEIRPQADYNKSLKVLESAKRLSKNTFIKSGLMVGLGETYDEIKSLMVDLIGVGCEIITIGQYLAPSQDERHVPVERFVPLEEFESYRWLGLSLGFKYVMSAPLVRSSYLAEEGYQECIKKERLAV